MKARLLLQERVVLHEGVFVEMTVWELPKPVSGCSHSFKYRLAYVINGACRLRYDNESGKGDHKHVGRREVKYRFTTLEALQTDFWTDVEGVTKS